MTDYKELDMTIHENCIHYPICLVNDYIHNRCGYYFEKPKQGEWVEGSQGYYCSLCDEYDQFYFEHDFCPNCGADMRVKNELNRVSKELNSEIEYKAKVKELEDAIAKCEKAEKDFKSRTCKFRSPTNCDFCSFHSDCDEHWKEGDEK